MPRREAPGPVPPWEVGRRVRDSLFDPIRRDAGPLRTRETRPTPEPRGVCRHCRRLNFTGAADHCGRRRCPGYLGLWLNDQRIRVMNNVVEYGATGGQAFLVTLTAPGAELLPWDRAACRHGEGVKCSGKRGCRVLQADADRWNSSADRRWSLLHDAAAAAVRRRHGAGALVLLAYSCELQARGVLHWHLLVGFSTARQRAAAHHYVNNLHRLAPDYGFGWADRKIKPRAAWQAASYASKYLVKERAAGGIGEVVLSGACPRRPVYVASRLTVGTRCTMRNLRLKRACFTRWGVSAEVREAEALWALSRVLGDPVVVDDDPMATEAASNAP